MIIKDAVISGRFVEYFELRWYEEISPVQLAGRFNRWLYDDEFIQNSLPDLDQAGHCLFSINPM